MENSTDGNVWQPGKQLIVLSYCEHAGVIVYIAYSAQFVASPPQQKHTVDKVHLFLAWFIGRGSHSTHIAVVLYSI